MTYDPRWHPDVARFARNLADPANAPEIRRRAQRMYDHWETYQVSEPEFFRRLDAFRAYERDPRCRHGMHPLLIDTNLVETAAMLPFVRPQTLGWFRRFHDELLGIAERTAPLRQALLLAQSFPDIDADLGIAC